MKFFGVLQLTCDSIKIIPGSEARKQVTMMPQVALLPLQPLADQETEAGYGAFFRSHFPKGNLFALYNVSLHGVYFKCPPPNHERLRSLLNRKLLSLRFWAQDHGNWNSF